MGYGGINLLTPDPLSRGLWVQGLGLGLRVWDLELVPFWVIYLELPKREGSRATIRA